MAYKRKAKTVRKTGARKTATRKAGARKTAARKTGARKAAPRKAKAKKAAPKRMSRAARSASAKKAAAKRVPFGGYTISFAGCSDTMESVFGKQRIAPSEMNKRIWAYVTLHRLSKK